MRITDSVLAHPRWTIAIMFVMTIGLGHGMRFLSADTDVTNDLPQEIPAKKLYDRIDELFPAKELVLIGITDDQLFTVGGIEKLDRLTHRIEGFPEIQSVLSPTNARIISATDDGMRIREAADPLPKSSSEANALRRELLSQPLFKGSLIDDAGKAVAMLAFVRAGVREADAAERIIQMAEDPQQNEGLTLDVTGRSAATYWAKVLMGRDMGMLSSAALLIVIGLLIAFFRSVRGVLLPLCVVVTSVIWTLGLMGYVGQPITHSTEVLPILLIAIGVADGIHILKGYYARSREADQPYTVVRSTMRDLNRPVILTSFTTAVGFLALNTSGIESIMALGLLTAFGVMSAMAFSLTVIPATLSLLGLPGNSKRDNKLGQQFVSLEAAATKYAGFLTRHKLLMAVAILLVIAGAIVGATRVPVEFSNVSNFRPDHPFRIATERVNENFASATSLTIIVEGGESNAIKDPAILHKMDALESYLREHPHVGSVQSLTGFIKQMHKVMHDDKADEYRIPNRIERETALELVEEDGGEVERPVEFDVPGKELVAQYLALYEMSGKPGDLANLVTFDFSTARINVFVDSDKASVLTDLHEDVSAFINAHFGETKAQLTGMAELMRAVNAMVVEGQGWSIATSLLLVFLLTAFMFRSALLGIFASLPLFFSLFLNFGTMGLFGIPLNVMTMATSSVAVGVGIDYAIHFVHRFQHERTSGITFADATRATMRESGVAIFLNASIVAAGFFALFFSEFSGVAHMGLLIALTMVTSSFAALTVLPVVFLSFEPKVFSAREAKTTTASEAA